MKQSIIYLLLLLLISIPFKAYSAPTKGNDNLRIIECKELYNNRKYVEVRDKSKELIEISKQSGNTYSEICGMCYYLLSRVYMGYNEDYTTEVDTLLSIIEQIEDTPENYNLFTLYNKTLSLYYQLVMIDYTQAANYAFKALEYARKDEDIRDEVDVLCSLASIYFSKNDSTGISYTNEAYAKSKDINYLPGLYRASVNVSNFLFNRREFEKSLVYLEEAVEIAKNLNYIVEMQYIESFFGDIYHNLGNYSKAEEYYKKAIINRSETSNYDKLYARLCYAQFLFERERYSQSLTLYLESEKISQAYNIPIFNRAIYLYISNCYSAAGQYKDALEYYKKYDEAKEREFNTEKEKEFSILDLKYRVAQEKEKNALLELEALRQNRNMTLLFSVIFIVIILAAFLFILYRRSQHRYKEIVRTQLENLDNERRLKQQLELLQQQFTDVAEKSTFKYNGSSLSEEKACDLFNQIEHLMQSEKIYRKTDLTIEKLATMLNTNRSYLSQVINETTHKSYSTYINDYRIKDAMEMLSDANNDEPIKAIAITIGFASPSNFYTIFKNKVGISPVDFRKNAQIISKSQ